MWQEGAPRGARRGRVSHRDSKRACLPGHMSACVRNQVEKPVKVKERRGPRWEAEGGSAAGPYNLEIGKCTLPERFQELVSPRGDG